MCTVYDEWCEMIKYIREPLHLCWKDLCNHSPEVFEKICKKKGLTTEAFTTKMLNAEHEFQEYLKKLIEELKEDN